MPGAPSSFLLLVVRPGATSSFLLLVAMPFAPTSDVPVQVSRIVFQLGSKSIFSSVGVISDCYQ